MYFSESDEDDISLEVSGSDTSFDDFSSSEENNDSTAPTVAIGPDSVSWTKLSNEGMTRPPFPFTGNSDVHFDVDQATGPLQYFEKFFDNDIVDLIVEETNTYADQCGSTDWKCLPSNEFRVFLAVNFLQSVVQEPQQQMYWTKDPVLETPFVRKCMPFKRFQKIK